jgi:hypothetical protein
MQFERKPSFERSYKKLTNERKQRAYEALGKLISFLEGGPKPEGLGLKKLKETFWEIRSDIKDRILFRFIPGKVEFILIGNHDEIHRALKR